MPLTAFQLEVIRLLAVNRTEDSHLAGGAALHFEPTSTRYSNDIDYFHDSESRVSSAFEADRKLLSENGYDVSADMSLSGYIRATVSKQNDRTQDQTKVEWAHDSAWRFMPAEQHAESGYRLHPLDLAVNKVLALAGRNEARDFLDVLTVHAEVLPLGALCWAAAGKDPGFTPMSILELLKRRGRFQPQDFAALHLVAPADPVELKSQWLTIVDEADAYIATGEPDDVGCVYYDKSRREFVAPSPVERESDVIMRHFGQPGGVLPQLTG